MTNEQLIIGAKEAMEELYLCCQGRFLEHEQTAYNYLRLMSDRIAELEDELAELKASHPLQVDWSKAPEWAQYHAFDANGLSCFYEEMPRKGRMMWQSQGGDRFFETINKPFDWTKTLTKRPETT